MKTTPFFSGKNSIALEFLSPDFSELDSVHPDRSYVDLFFFSIGSTTHTFRAVEHRGKL